MPVIAPAVVGDAPGAYVIKVTATNVTIKGFEIRFFLHECG